MANQENLNQENLINPSSPSLCDECCSSPWKYRCPGCSLKSCSLPCVKSHKDRTSCTGKRNRTEFVPLSQFDDNLLISDYNMLEDTKRAAESARRMAGSYNSFRGYIGFRLPRSLMMLRNTANRRGTKLLILPPGMSKREANRSRFNFRKKAIFWTVEWRFNATDVVLVDHFVDERVSLFSVVEKHLVPIPLKNQLSAYRNVPIDDLKFFIRKTPQGPKSPFRELDIRAPIGKQLADVVILEYPVVFVFLPSHSYEFEVDKVSRLSTIEPSGSFERKPSPEGTLFMEEEMEEGEVSDTLITDLTDHMKSGPPDSIQIQQHYPLAEKVNVSEIHRSRKDANVNQTPAQHETKMAYSARPFYCGNNQVLQNSGMQISRGVVESSKPDSEQKPHAIPPDESEIHPSCPVNSLMPLEDDEFDFQQELKDAYSDLVGEINPDDFLCLDGGYNGVENFNEFFVDEELEEGEIPS